ncbi:MAG: hypothetical protein ACYDCL_00295 [Myxococcales bacterium]
MSAPAALRPELLHGPLWLLSTQQLSDPGARHYRDRPPPGGPIQLRMLRKQADGGPARVVGLFGTEAPAGTLRADGIVELAWTAEGDGRVLLWRQSNRLWLERLTLGRAGRVEAATRLELLPELSDELAEGETYAVPLGRFDGLEETVERAVLYRHPTAMSLVWERRRREPSPGPHGLIVAVRSVARQTERSGKPVEAVTCEVLGPF